MVKLKFAGISAISEKMTAKKGKKKKGVVEDRHRNFEGKLCGKEENEKCKLELHLNYDLSGLCNHLRSV